MARQLAWLMVLAVASVTAASPALAAGNSAMAMGNAEATVVLPIAVTQAADLDFGVIVSNPGSAGTVVLGPTTAPAQYLGGVQAGCDATSGCPIAHAARFDVAGEANRSYAITAPASISITGQAADGSAAQALTVEGISLKSASRPADGAAGMLDGNGHDSFSLGGTLQVPASLPPARYRVSLQVIVTYI